MQRSRTKCCLFPTTVNQSSYYLGHQYSSKLTLFSFVCFFRFYTGLNIFLSYIQAVRQHTQCSWVSNQYQPIVCFLTCIRSKRHINFKCSIQDQSVTQKFCRQQMEILITPCLTNWCSTSWATQVGNKTFVFDNLSKLYMYSLYTSNRGLQCLRALLHRHHVNPITNCFILEATS